MLSYLHIFAGLTIVECFSPARGPPDRQSLLKLLSKRRGTDSRAWTPQDFADGDSDDDDYGDYGDAFVPHFKSPRVRSMPVADPWQKGKPLHNNDYTRRKDRVLEVDDLSEPDEEHQRDELKQTNASIQHGKSAVQRGFIFQAPTALKIKTAIDQKSSELPHEKVQPKERAPQSDPSLPILDEDGEPVYLTLEQAKKVFTRTSMDLSSKNDLDIIQFAPRASNWTELGVTSVALLANLKRMDCACPLHVQQEASRAILAQKDVLVGTYTGSGKTLAFLVPLAQNLLSNLTVDGPIQILIVAPGRELASQIVSVARELLQNTGLEVVLAIGGTTFARNVENIRRRKPAVLVGTPGRLAELIVGQPGEKSGKVKISKCQALVLDECDSLLEYKAHRDVTQAMLQHIKQRLGNRIQTVMCSATASDLLRSKLVENVLRPDYVQVMGDQHDVLVTNAKVGARISLTTMHGVIHVPHSRLVMEFLRRILHTEPLPQQVLIFVESARKVDVMVEKLASLNIIAASLHGLEDKRQRADVSLALRQGYVGLVVSTELAARGLDAPWLTHVINADLPTDPSHYAHRAGRCGRGGRPGIVINLTTHAQERNVPQKLADQLGIELHTVEVRNGRLNVVEVAGIK